MLIFTDFVPDPNVRYDMGFLLVILVGVNLVVNLGFLFWTQPRTVYNWLKSKYTKFAGKKPVRVQIKDKRAPSKEI